MTVATPIEREVLEWDEYTGHLAATHAVEIRARVSGYLEAVQFRPGRSSTRARSSS